MVSDAESHVYTVSKYVSVTGMLSGVADLYN
jgi:hypothetical protein